MSLTTTPRAGSPVHTRRTAAAPTWHLPLVTDYLQDVAERHVLFLDTLRQRGNNYAEQAGGEAPDLLSFAHELVLDGRDLPQPCNYRLLRILPPKGVAIDPASQPVVVVDPRAGHGPGIGGFKFDSEVGVALRAGHPVYFVGFAPQPEEGQTLRDVGLAEAQFLQTVAARHPKCSVRPLVIANCQAGWAMAGLAALRPELFGMLVLVGAPLSYWAGGASMNPMRYSGAVLGGSWLASLSADLNGDRFDGANLVKNFENLNPANSLWGRYYKLWSQVDTEAERYLDFERWWGGYFRMTGHELESIVENLFVGNRLARGEVRIDGQHIKLRNITAPVVVFASQGDNITPPPQALNWIIDVWGDERAIAAAGRVIIYVLHEKVGHLGIFVGADVARKEHDQIVTSVDVISHLPPGLYEMKLRLKDGQEVANHDPLEPGSYGMHFEPRSMDDLRALNPEGREEEKLFSTVAKVSGLNALAYKTWVRPWLRPLAVRGVADATLDLHSLRSQRRALSDVNPAVRTIADLAEHVREHRHAVVGDHPARHMEHTAASWIETWLNLYRDLRDQGVVHFARQAYGPLGLGALLPPDTPDEERALARAQGELAEVRRQVLPHIAEGGYPHAVCRILLAAMLCSGSLERRHLRLAQRLAERRLPGPNGQVRGPAIAWDGIIRNEARINAVAPAEAWAALGEMLPDRAARERAVAVAVAVLMMEPGTSGPASVLIEQLMADLGLSPKRVATLVQQLKAQVSAAPARKKTRSQLRR